MAFTNKSIWIKYAHIKFFLEQYNFWAPKETGGILMGYKLEHKIYVTDIVGPGPKAIHEKESFTPDNDYHENEIAQIYERSGRIHTYIGEWHTHPENESYLSGRDKKTLKNISTNPLCRLPQPVMIILGTSPFEFKSWLYNPKAAISFQELKINICSA